MTKSNVPYEPFDDPDKPVRHIVSMSGGKDSTALALHLSQTRPELEEANRIEAEWFAEYVPHSQGTCGIRALTDKIVNALESYTANTWFGLERKRLLTEREKAKVNLNVLGSFIPSSLDDLITQTRKLLPEAK